MRKEIEVKFIKERTRLLSEMLDNPDNCGIYPTTDFFNKLDRLVSDLVEFECVCFGAEFAYKEVNPNSEMCTPNCAYIKAQQKYNEYKNKL